MKQVRITKIFNIEMAHALLNYDGKCRNIHGHSYSLHVSVSGVPINDDTRSDSGMVMDFTELKRIVKKHIIDKFDHAFVVNQSSPFPELPIENQPFHNILKVPFQPTSEQLILHFSEILQSVLPENVHLHSLQMFETATSYVTWENPDNIR